MYSILNIPVAVILLNVYYNFFVGKLFMLEITLDILFLDTEDNISLSEF